MSLDATDAPPKKSGPSMVIQLVVVLVLTLAAAGGGWFAGMTLQADAPPAETPEPVKVQVDPIPGQEAEGEGGDAKAEVQDDVARDEEGKPILIPRMVPLEAVTTNLAAPSDIWVRMELAIVFSAPPPPEMVRTIHEDILAYMRTVTLQQVQGASGFRHLKTDLEERARIRSDGLATQLMIRTLLFE
jgi:flagellar FliL protein